jgi:glycosyltransferase involved in cell wall biosynthesis
LAQLLKPLTKQRLHLAYFVSHPIQYQAPLLRLIAADPEIDLSVFFYSDFSLKPYRDSEFGQMILWDVPLTEGYSYEMLDCWGSQRWKGWVQQPIAHNIRQRLKTGQFDAVWVHGWGWLCSLQAISAAVQLGIPVLLRGEAHELKQPVLRQSMKHWVKRWVLSRLFSKVDQFLAIGTLNQQFYQSYGIPDQQICQVPYAVDNAFFQKQAALARPQRESLRRSLGLDENRPIILYAAKLIQKKRPQDLLAAYRLLSKDGRQEPEPYLLFVGDGALKPELESAGNHWQSIRFLGFRNQSELPALYDLCDVFVLPSDFEPWGLAINEVMNAAKAVVVSDQVGCAIDLVKDGDNGRIFPVGDVRALAEAIQWAIAHSTQAGQKSLQRINTWSFAEDLQGVKQALSDVSIKVG